MIKLPFRDRAEAGRLLGDQLLQRSLATGDVIVLALPRGGLPVAAEIAAALHAPLDTIVVRKLGVPSQPEYALGAITAYTRFLDYGTIEDLEISNEEIEAVIAIETAELRRRERIYRKGAPPARLGGRIVIVVDDGLATGATMAAAARYIRNEQPMRLIAAAPVGSRQACQRILREAGECVCLAQPEPFSSVGEWYEDFHQITDAEAEAILARFPGSAARFEK